MADSDLSKRVRKACDRCRLRKTKCDGRVPCARCEAENGICVFGNRMKFRNGVYPRGYVEKLLQDKEWLAKGVQELYQRLESVHGWKGPLLAKPVSGIPDVHSILSGLGILESVDEEDGSANPEEESASLDVEFTIKPTNDNSLRHPIPGSIISPPKTPLSRKRGKLTEFHRTLGQDINPYHSPTQPAPLPTPPIGDLGPSAGIENQDSMQEDGKGDHISPLGRWNLDNCQAFHSAPIRTEDYSSSLHMPRSSDSGLPADWGQFITPQHEEQPQQTPTTQLGVQLDYFSLGTELAEDSTSAMQFFADLDTMLEQRFSSWEEGNSSEEA